MFFHVFNIEEPCIHEIGSDLQTFRLITRELLHAAIGSDRFTHYRDNRAISILEVARLQGFDDDYAFIGTKEQKKTQVGNAVPPLLACSVAEHIHKAIFRKQSIPTILSIVAPKSTGKSRD